MASTIGALANLLSLPLSQMRYVAAYVLAVLGGKKNPSAEDVTAILEAAGASVDNEPLETLLKELDGKNIWEVIDAGRAKFASVPSGGAAPAAAAPAAGAAAPAAAAPAAKAKDPEPESESGEVRLERERRRLSSTNTPSTG